MKILVLLSRCDQTGMTTNTYDLCHGLISQGHSVTLLVGKCNKNDVQMNNRFRAFQQLNIRIRVFPSLEKGMLRRCFATIKILWSIITTPHDIIHVESPYLTFCPWLLRKKFTSTFHVNDLVPCFYYKNATHLIAISKETKEYAMEHFGFHENDITIVNHGVNERFAQLISLEQRTAIKLKYGIPDGKIIISLVGSIEKRKGQHILLEACKRLPKDCIDQLHIVLLGSSKDGQTNEWLIKVIESTLGWSKVTHIEYSDSKPIYDISEIFVLPSFLEGFGLVVIEAMLSGACVIRTNSEGASEQIINGETGFIFNKGRIDELCVLLEELIRQPSLRTAVANRGRLFALDHFTDSVMASNCVKVYEKIIHEY